MVPIGISHQHYGVPEGEHLRSKCCHLLGNKIALCRYFWSYCFHAEHKINICPKHYKQNSSKESPLFQNTVNTFKNCMLYSNNTIFCHTWLTLNGWWVISYTYLCWFCGTIDGIIDLAHLNLQNNGIACEIEEWSK